MGISTPAGQVGENLRALRELPALPLAENLCPDSLAAQLREAENVVTNQLTSANPAHQLSHLGWLNAELAAATPGDEAAEDHFEDARIYASRGAKSTVLVTGLFHAVMLGLATSHLADRRWGTTTSQATSQEQKLALATLTHIISDAPLHDHTAPGTTAMTNPDHRPCFKEGGSRLHQQTTLGTHLLFMRQGLCLTPASPRERSGPERHTAYAHMNTESGPSKLPIHISVKNLSEAPQSESPILYISFRHILQSALDKLDIDPQRYGLKELHTSAVKWLAQEVQGKKLSENSQAVLDEMGRDLGKAINTHLNRL